MHGKFFERIFNKRKKVLVNSIIEVNAQSSIKVKGSKILRFDPYKITGEPKDADYIFITHAHSDHFSLSDIEKVRKASTKFIIPETMHGLCLEKGLNDDLLILFKPGKIIDIDDLRVESVASYNIGKTYHPKDKNWLGYIVEINDICIFVSGDTDMNPDNLNIDCDVAVVPVGGKYTMDPMEAAEYINRIKPQVVIPTHYKTSAEADEFEKNVKKGIQVLRLLEKVM